MSLFTSVRRAFTRTSPILVTGASGKTGSRVAARLAEDGHEIRLGSRRAEIPFDWNAPQTWPAVLKDVKAAYIAYSPDLAVPGAVELITRFVEAARTAGVTRLVLLSGRGEAEAQACEQIVLKSGLEATVVRASWFNQNFTEGGFADMVQAGQITLPGADVREPFIDVEDIAEVAATALTEAGHAGEIYEVTGPRLMGFDEMAEILSKAAGRPIAYIPIPHTTFLDGLKAQGAPGEVVWLMDYLFSTVFDGRNAHVCDGVERALGRKPTDFETFARRAAAAGAFKVSEPAE
ncbi:NmrA family NAD(P)-binding protein [Oceanicaulis sp. MMSF_3324]|uniref:NmrA family NAD(P)-binding protein n=1 Tax=Oceanicaulis sp. MMSF_3324 TaxID=3046702 RepID=UPI00273DF5A7|nr:NAD(P)H-binding protein [Oceanicaulis sp. MMSF_3324]